jgi:hypothetical protein
MHDKRPRQHQPQTQQKQAARCTGTLEAMSSAAAVVVVICAGSWRGSIEVASDAVTVGSLKRQLCSISGLAAVKLIVAGRSLKVKVSSCTPSRLKQARKVQFRAAQWSRSVVTNRFEWYLCLTDTVEKGCSTDASEVKRRS